MQDQTKKYSLLLIEWYDLWGLTKDRNPQRVMRQMIGLRPEANKSADEKEKVVSVGWLVKNAPTFLELACTVTAKGQYVGIMNIPKTAISKAHLIEKGTDPVSEV